MIEFLIGLGFALFLIFVIICCIAIKEIEDDKHE